MLKKFLFIIFSVIVVISYILMPLIRIPLKEIISTEIYSNQIVEAVVDITLMTSITVGIFAIFIVLPLHGFVTHAVSTTLSFNFTELTLLGYLELLLPLLPFIGMFFVKKKPAIYRIFVYTPLLISIACTLSELLSPELLPYFLFPELSFWYFFIIKDIAYLLCAVILDIEVNFRSCAILRVIKKTLLTILVTLSLLVLVIALLLAFFVWYFIYDTSGLVEYKDETIAEIMPADDRVYIITEEGYGYMAGDYDIPSRKYLNSEFHEHEELGTPPPIRFFDEKIKSIKPYSNEEILIITQNNELYWWKNFEVEKVLDNVSSVDVQSIGDFAYLYVIDTDGVLKQMDESKNITQIATDVADAHVYRESVFVLYNNGELCELTFSADLSYKISDPIFTDVQKFDILDTSIRIKDNELVYDDPAAIKLPLVNVLTNDGKLYAKGAYNILCCTRDSRFNPSKPEIFEEWTLFEENVVDFSMSASGTLMLLNDATASFYGYDPVINTTRYTLYGFKYYKIPQTDIVDISSGETCVCLEKSDGTFLFWGSNFFFDDYDHTDTFTSFPLFDKDPYVLCP